MFFYKLAFSSLLPLSVWYFNDMHFILKNAAFISLEVYKKLKIKSKVVRHAKMMKHNEQFPSQLIFIWFFL